LRKTLSLRCVASTRLPNGTANRAALVVDRKTSGATAVSIKQGDVKNPLNSRGVQDAHGGGRDLFR
jgi:hypothetical protein